MMIANSNSKAIQSILGLYTHELLFILTRGCQKRKKANVKKRMAGTKQRSPPNPTPYSTTTQTLQVNPSSPSLIPSLSRLQSTYARRTDTPSLTRGVCVLVHHASDPVLSITRDPLHQCGSREGIQAGDCEFCPITRNPGLSCMLLPGLCAAAPARCRAWNDVLRLLCCCCSPHQPGNSLPPVRGMASGVPWMPD